MPLEELVDSLQIVVLLREGALLGDGDRRARLFRVHEIHGYGLLYPIFLTVLAVRQIIFFLFLGFAFHLQAFEIYILLVHEFGNVVIRKVVLKEAVVDRSTHENDSKSGIFPYDVLHR